MHYADLNTALCIVPSRIRHLLMFSEHEVTSWAMEWLNRKPIVECYANIYMQMTPLLVCWTAEKMQHQHNFNKTNSSLLVSSWRICMLG